ncbi:LysR family transcriptional regulator [Falsiruegeria mediterranea]|jgi:DNA-binding transcriptional LysR family regulator|uniref:PCP degradation transcriptional activation protein n=1 Tax=Falsiruegeria mediterranea M17 TaxID=1200281 RepID=A0A2R8C2W2_9RHOB|nr:LysR family transcriptional regulator [Falsiruegeria mediterranea]SPJ26768.1 PCP degradation transcriptional activation protein [Falsiruegeria mediterranea M17]
MNFKNFDLNLLRILAALLKTGSTTRAGQQIGLSQPAVSAALARLRHALNDPLFVRQGRNLIATEYAETLREPLIDLLDQTEILLKGPETFDPKTDGYDFLCSGSDFFGELLIPHLADHMTQHAPLVRIRMQAVVAETYADPLINGADLALLPAAPFPKWVESQFLFQSHFIVIARRNNPMLSGRGAVKSDRISLDAFCAAQHVLFSPEGKFHGYSDAALLDTGRSRTVALTLPTFSGVGNAVAHSDMIALMPHQMAQYMAPRIGLDLFQPPIVLEPIDLVMAWHQRTNNSPAHRWLRDMITLLSKPLQALPSRPA